MAEDALGLEVSDNDALHDLAAAAGFLDLLVVRLLALELASALHTAAGDEEVVHADARHSRDRSISGVGRTKASPHDAELAP